jgi:tetratricopeptide (TPR) repeat protein
MRTPRIMAGCLLMLAIPGCAARARPPRTVTAPPPVRQRGPIETARARPPAPPAPARPPAAHADDGPLTAKIDASTPAGRTAALRLIEEGRQRLAAGDAARAIELFERAIAVDGRVPYAYYFLAKAHAHADHRALAHRFLDRAEQKLGSEPYWLSEVWSLRGTLLARDGKRPEAEAAYRRALEAWPGNRVAAEALTAAGRHGKESP